MTPETDAPIALPRDVLHSLALLSCLPVPHPGRGRGGRAAWAYPVAGLAVGAVAALAGLMAHLLGLPAPLAALVSLAALVVVTGAMHEDGLADTADGLWGGWTPAQRLEIMKDSRIGAYGVIALVLGLAARWAALWLLFEAGPGIAAAAILAAAALSRAAMPALMTTLPASRAGGLSHGVGPVPKQTAALAAGLGLLAALLLTGGGAFGALFWTGVATAALGATARARIGGQTGDILGAAQQLAEIAILFSLVV